MLIDLAKAFNTLSSDKPLSKLNRYGFREKPYELLESLIESRRQIADNENHRNEMKKLEFGVPLGTVYFL